MAFFRLYRSGAHLLLRSAGCRPFDIHTSVGLLRCWQLGPEDGEPWLMLHGLGSQAAAWWVLLRALRHDCNMIVPELSELGGSEVPGGGLAVRDGARAAKELVSTCFGARPAVVVGTSLGGWTALRLALDHPELVSRLVLVTPGGYREQDWDRIEDLVRVADDGDADALVEAMFLRPPLPKRFLRRGFRAAFTSPAVTGPLDKLSEDDALSDAELARITAPTALIWGEHDGIFSIDVAERMAAALPRSVVYRVATAAHIVQWESPRRLIDAVRDFRRRSFEPPRAGEAA
jgi:pimeloyl-ACP methyl ester carboxylesterase